ncbi:MAG: alpha/beta hydrolase [Verrucomicrobiales bacterium]|nr:alpha/beta hydrolase [Verrucomicrobiales bacterium]
MKHAQPIPRPVGIPPAPGSAVPNLRARKPWTALLAAVFIAQSVVRAVDPAEADLGTEGYATSGDVRIHYVTQGTGPLLVLIHGFPDYWYSWRNQIPALARHFQVVAMDQRGFNLSGQPTGVSQYSMDLLVGDVAAVIRHFGKARAGVVGHDWGGAVAWQFAMRHPEMTDRLVVLNLPHPAGFLRELATNPRQQSNSAYARHFQQPDAAASLSAEQLASWLPDTGSRSNYVAAFRRSSLEGMLNFYKANYPREPYTLPTQPFPKVQCPVLLFHGLKDTALLSDALSGTWNWVDRDLTLVTIPDASHWVHLDAPDRVTRTLLCWLTSQ